MLAIGASAKDKVYESGSVTASVVKTGGWTDTTFCADGGLSYHCSGGITEDVELVYALRMSDGMTVELNHEALLGRDILKSVAASCPCAVKYRIENHRSLLGGSYSEVMILMGNGKETKYNVSGSPAPAKAKPNPGLAQ